MLSPTDLLEAVRAIELDGRQGSIDVDAEFREFARHRRVGCSRMCSQHLDLVRNRIGYT